VGTLKLTTAGADITDSGSLVVTGATTIDAGGADITLDHGSSSLQGAVGASGRNVSLTHPTGIDLGASTVTGTYGVTATTGNITDAGALSITGLTTLVTSADGGDITINRTGHAFTGNVKVTTNETNSDKDAHATIDGGSTIGLKIARGSEIQGNLTLISGHANTITDEGSSGVVTVDGNLTATTNANNGSITLNDIAVDGTIVLNTHGSGNATVVNDVGLQFASSTVGGNLHATSTTGNMTQSGALDIEGTTTLITSADDATINLGTSSNAFTGALLITTNDSGADTAGDVSIHGGTTALVLGDSTIDGDLTLTSTATSATGITDTGTLDIRGTTTISASGVDITLNSAANNFQGAVGIDGSDVILVDAGTVDLGASTVTGTYNLTAGGSITDSGALAITGATTIDASSGNVTLNTTTNNFQGAVKIDGVNVVVVDAGAIDLGASTVTGTYAVTATAGGNIIDSGVLAITGAATFTAASGQSIYLDSANTFSSTIAFTSGGTLTNVTISDSNDFDFAALTLSGNLNATSTGGSVTDSGALAITGVTTVDASSGNVTLDTATNNFQGAVEIDGVNVLVVDGGAIDLGASTVTGTYAVTATTGNISDSGNLAVTGTATFITGASGSNIILDASGNAFSNAVTLQADDGSDTFGNITFVDSGAVRLHSSAGANGDLYINAATDAAVGGNLNVTATTGNITQGRVVVVSGTSSFTTNANNATITLDNANAFTGAVVLNTTGSTGHAEVDGGTTQLDIAASTVGGNLSLTSGHATGITDSGTVTVGGNLTVTNDVSNGDINMGSLAVDGTIALTTSGSGGDVTLMNDENLDFATSNIGGDLDATATTGDITDSGTLTVTGVTEMTLGISPDKTTTGETSVTVEGDAMTLDNSVFTGGITLNYSGALVIVVDDSNPDIDLAGRESFISLIGGIDQINFTNNLHRLARGYSRSKELKDATEQNNKDKDEPKDEDEEEDEEEDE
jgi:hypothetical protein